MAGYESRISTGLAAILSKRLKKLNINQAIEQSVDDHSDQIADLNTEQLHRGEKANGGTTGIYADVAYKGRLSPVDLYDTGDFHKSISVDPFGKAFELKATDPKTDELQDRYGDEILGLTDQNITEAGEIIKETMVDKVREQL